MAFEKLWKGGSGIREVIEGKEKNRRVGDADLVITVRCFLCGIFRFFSRDRD